jgi:hypothetical protein
LKSKKSTTEKVFFRGGKNNLQYQHYNRSLAPMSKPSPEPLTQLVVRVPDGLFKRLEALAANFRGGRSEVARRAIVAGLPLVINQLNRRRAHK